MGEDILTTKSLIEEAYYFCESESKLNHSDLIGITDDERIGTYIEHRFLSCLESKFLFTIGHGSHEIVLPDKNINTDIKISSIAKPQSCCFFNDARQKIYGLGYNLLVFIYDKHDEPAGVKLKFTHCTYVDKDRTGDYIITQDLRRMVNENSANIDDIKEYLRDKNLPIDDISLNKIANEIIEKVPEQGYLAISNAHQWRLAYRRVIGLKNEVKGVKNFVWET